MVTDEIVDAIDMMIEICSDEKQALGMKSVREMLCDFDEGCWLCMERPTDCYEWLEQYLSCKRKLQKKVPVVTEKCAVDSLIESLERGEKNEVGDRTSEYMVIAVSADGKKKVYAAICEEKAGLKEGAWGYSLHIINDVDNTSCCQLATDHLDKDELVSLIADTLWKLQNGEM